MPPLTVLFRLAQRLSDRRELVDADVARWAAVEQRRGDVFAQLVRRLEFRSLLYHRLATGNTRGRICAVLLRVVWPGQVACYLPDNLGPGLYIQHGFATAVDAVTMGANCWIAQQVTVGFNVRDGVVLGPPLIEDDVTIYAGALVIGDVHLGRGAVVAAGAVVTKDVPAGMIAMGVPAQNRMPRVADPLDSPLAHAPDNR